MADPFELRRIVDDLCRKDFFAFAIRAFPILEPGKLYMAPHIAIICFLLMKVFRGDVRRALVCIPPRYLKTYLISIAYPAWLLGKDPKTRIICASYGTDLAEKFSADTLKLMKSAWYKRIFPNTHLDPKQQNKTEIGTTVGGYRFATSTGATLTGRGADVIIIDDPIKASEAIHPRLEQVYRVVPVDHSHPLQPSEEGPADRGRAATAPGRSSRAYHGDRKVGGTDPPGDPANDQGLRYRRRWQKGEVRGWPHPPT